MGNQRFDKFQTIKDCHFFAAVVVVAVIIVIIVIVVVVIAQLLCFVTHSNKKKAIHIFCHENVHRSKRCISEPLSGSIKTRALFYSLLHDLRRIQVSIIYKTKILYVKGTHIDRLVENRINVNEGDGENMN